MSIEDMGNSSSKKEPIIGQETREDIKPTRFREHRSGITDSKETEVVINNREELVAHCKSVLDGIFDFEPDELKVELYHDQVDKRIGWDKTYVVTIDGYGVVGFTDSPCDK